MNSWHVDERALRAYAERDLVALERASVAFGKKPGQKRELKRSLAQAHVLTDLVYGLVNVRTDGDKILCATRNESDLGWETKTIRSRC